VLPAPLMPEEAKAMSRADSVLSSPSMFNFFLHVFFSLELPCCILITPSPVAFLYEKNSPPPIIIPLPVYYPSITTNSLCTISLFSRTILSTNQPYRIYTYTDSCKPFFLSSPSFTITTLGKQTNALYNVPSSAADEGKEI